MPTPTAQPNTNLQQPQNFRLQIEALPDVLFNCQAVTFPGVGGGEVEVPTPFQHQYLSGTSFQHDPLVLTILLNEDLSSYYSLVTWIKNRTISESFTDYNAQAASDAGLISDASLQFYTSANNPSVIATFTDLFPLSVGGFQLDATTEVTSPITFQAQFQYQLFSLKQY